jgi:TRAP-type C4-dicarboxylate transport system permease small subunit
MRRALDRLYQASGALAALFMVAICAIVLLQVGANLLDSIIAVFGGRPLGLLIPSYAEFAGFFLAASSFLALAYTLRRGSHIRVALLVQHLTGRRRRIAELWCIAVAAVLSSYFALFAVNLAYDSLRFGDVSPGMVPVSLWIPQSAVALGLVVLTVALFDELVSVLRGEDPSYQGQEDSLLAGDGGNERT